MEEIRKLDEDRTGLQPVRKIDPNSEEGRRIAAQAQEELKEKEQRAPTTRRRRTTKQVIQPTILGVFGSDVEEVVVSAGTAPDGDSLGAIRSLEDRIIVLMDELNIEKERSRLAIEAKMHAEKMSDEIRIECDDLEARISVLKAANENLSVHVARLQVGIDPARDVANANDEWIRRLDTILYMADLITRELSEYRGDNEVYRIKED